MTGRSEFKPIKPVIYIDDLILGTIQREDPRITVTRYGKDGKAMAKPLPK